jgi:hypothetical protein
MIVLGTHWNVLGTVPMGSGNGAVATHCPMRDCPMRDSNSNSDRWLQA